MRKSNVNDQKLSASIIAERKAIEQGEGKGKE